MGPQDLLDALDEIVYVSDPNTYELLYANRRCRSLLPTRDYKGKPCYALLQGQPAPCPYCTNARLTPDKFYVWEFNNPSMGRHFLLKDIRNLLEEKEEEQLTKDLNMYVLNLFYTQPFESGRDFYVQFEERLGQMRKLLSVLRQD